MVSCSTEQARHGRHRSATGTAQNGCIGFEKLMLLGFAFTTEDCALARSDGLHRTTAHSGESGDLPLREVSLVEQPTDFLNYHESQHG